MFKVYSNPSNNKFPWFGAEEVEVILLSVFRLTSEMIAWKELLLLLEGQTVHLPSPKSHSFTHSHVTSHVMPHVT